MITFRSKMFFVIMSCFSILLNLFLIMNNNGTNSEKSWSRKASFEAEAVASLSCSGHGRAYLDGSLFVLENGEKPVCECNACYTGPDCSQFLPDCVVDAERYTHTYIYIMYLWIIVFVLELIWIRVCIESYKRSY